MTAEIVIMNREAVAMAADSAGTVEIEGAERVFSTDNKLFSFGSNHQVGVLVNNVMTFRGIPFEAILKEYRKEISESEFLTVKGYLDHFLSFLPSIHNRWDVTLESMDNRLDAFKQNLLVVLDTVLDKLRIPCEQFTDDDVIEASKKAHEENPEVWSDYFVSSLEEVNASLGGLPTPTSFTREDALSIWKDNYDQIQALVDQLGVGCFKQFEQAFLCLFEFTFTKEAYFIEGSETGLVFAGFGSKQIFPELIAVRIEGIFFGKLKWTLTDHYKLDNESKQALILPFAEHESIKTFLYGFDESIMEVAKAHIEEIVDSYVPDEKEQEKSALVEEFQRRIKEISQREFYNKIEMVVSYAPKDELAEMAKTLVNLQSFKKKVSADPETVGGPIDVAVVSKGDGLVWIERKHYFRQDLNHQFVARYYREGGVS